MKISESVNSQKINQASEEIGFNQLPEDQLTKIEHQSTLFAEPIFHIGNFTVTNSLINSWLAVIIIVILALVIRLKSANIPKGIQNYAELILEGAFNLADSVTGSRTKTLKFLPLVLV